MIYNVDITINASKLKEQPLLPQILQILNLIRPEWLPVNIRAKHFTGGITNVLYGYYEDGKFDQDVVLFRIDGEGIELMALHEAGCCAPLYAVYNNGLAYGFVHGEHVDENTVRDKKIRRQNPVHCISRAVFASIHVRIQGHTSSLQKHGVKGLIAKEICRLHAVRPEGQLFDVWRLAKKLLDLSPDCFPDNPDKQTQYEKTIQPKHILEKEFEELKVHLDAMNSPIVFCHNDLNLKNIIYNKEKGRIHFIDFEYALYSYEHADIAYHFCEYAGIDEIDVRRYPDKAYQVEWIRYYLECKAEQNGQTKTDIKDRDVEDFYVKVNKFTLMYYFIAVVWALTQARFSKLDFDFLGYARTKLDEYFARKDEFMSLQVPQ